MSLLPFCEWLASTPGSIALHESLYMYPLVESSHVLTLCLFVGMSVMWDLRLLGVVLPNVSMSDMSRRVWPLMLVGFILMSISGILLFYAIPIRSPWSLLTSATVDTDDTRVRRVIGRDGAIDSVFAAVNEGGARTAVKGRSL